MVEFRQLRRGAALSFRRVVVYFRRTPWVQLGALFGALFPSEKFGIGVPVEAVPSLKALSVDGGRLEGGVI